MGTRGNAAAAAATPPNGAQISPWGSQPNQATQLMNPYGGQDAQPSAGTPVSQMYPPTKPTPNAGQSPQLGQAYPPIPMNSSGAANPYPPPNPGSKIASRPMAPAGQQQAYPPQQQMNSYGDPTQMKYASYNPAAAAPEARMANSRPGRPRAPAAAPATANGSAGSAQPRQLQQPGRGIQGAGGGR